MQLPPMILHDPALRADWEAAWDAEVKAGGDPAFIGMLTWEQLEALCAAA